FWLPLNEKGRRDLRREPRRHAATPGRRSELASSITVTAAIEMEGDAPDHWLGCASPHDASDYARLLGPRLGRVREIVGGRSRTCSIGKFAAILGATHRSASLGGSAPWRMRWELRR